MSAYSTTVESIDRGSASLREDQVRLGLWMFLATVTMLFAAFTSAYVVRRSGTDWRHVPLPSILWFNTLVLAASSGAVEVASRSGVAGRRGTALVAMAAALKLGFMFLGGQLIAWKEMVVGGAYLASSPHSSFFFMLTAAHGVHVVAALAVLTWGAWRTLSIDRDVHRWEYSMEICRTFWHYLGAVWLFLFALVSLY